MKKLLLSVAVFATTLSFGQVNRDLEAILSTPASNAVVAPGTISVEFSIKNNGPDALNPGDTVFFGYAVGQDIFSFDGTINQVEGAIIPAGLTIPAGQSLPWAALTQVAGGGISIDMTAQTTVETICAIVLGVGSGALTASGDPADATPDNNIDCFTVNPNANISEITLNASVYPNPATNVLNIKMNEEVASVVISTLDGKVVATETSTSVNISELNTGMYIYTITGASGKVAKGNFVKN
jgi:hypothetical protein